MLAVGVSGAVAGGLEQLHLDLEGGVGQLAQDLGLGDNLGGHQVEDQNVQRTDVLVQGPVLGHDEDVFSLQHRTGRQGIGNLDGHGTITSGCGSFPIAYHISAAGARARPPTLPA